MNKKSSPYNTVYSLNNLTGEEHWKFKDGYEHRTPIVIDGNLLYYGDDMVFTAVNKNTRKIEWNFVDSKMKFSPGVIYNDDIIFGGSQTTFPPAGHGVYSINKMTGTIQWTFDGGHKKNNDGNDINEDFPNASCVIGNTVYASGSFGNVYAINANTGSLKWKYAYTTDDPRDTPICSDDTVYIGTGVDYKKGVLYAINAKTGKLKWQYNTEERASPPYINNGSIYFGSIEYPPYPADPKDYLYALDLQGNIKWKFEADGYVRSAPIADKGIVYFITESGSLYAINAITGKL
ncbi:MAG TPA: PQQ-binding-like beta-propeller repeat protein [Gammaproteobacteria bacterium]|nr:PQQ-binding-like beta-propeller repeat protein [Gammaproteobacteria bacterium]